MSKIKSFCSSNACNITRKDFTSFSYEYCSVCKEEVTEELAERRAIQNESNTNGYMEDNYWLFDTKAYEGFYPDDTI